jgi:acyl transferase domain-containing protein
MNRQDANDPREGLEVAIIGMACRFPGARNVDEFWRNLRDGVESISFYTDEQMKAFGVDSAALHHPNFVKAGAALKDMDLFDASFFGYSPREAELLDPQQRLFLECAWEAYESAGYSDHSYEGMVGVYAGASMSSYLLFNLLPNLDSEESFQMMIGNDKDFLSTRVSYEMNLRGPSIDVQTACSTSLVAVHLAGQALLSYQCDMALAGGVSIQVPQRTGHYFRPGDITSPDGHCRAFDAKAEGTIFGSGVGIVVLKRLSDALVDGDTIHAVIKGSAIDNDGSGKVGYTAPGLDGQAQVITMAHLLAEVDAETIGYVEAHGTGTALGDPVEVAALTKAFRVTTKRKGFCAIGSVKTNIGHLDAAAGVAGLIKTVLSLKHQMLLPSLHFERPNPRIDFEDGPFYVSAKLSAWEPGATPRRAAVSSFGIGGTNAHVVIEEAPQVAESSESRPWHLLMLSAKTPSALDAATTNLSVCLDENRELKLADVAYTHQLGRKSFNHRRVALCRDLDDALGTLKSLDPQRVFTAHEALDDRQVVFMFPGGGAQYVNMGLDLYQTEPVFRDHLDTCSELLRPLLGYDLRKSLYPNSACVEQVTEQIRQTSLGLPALFSIEYALAKLWMSWGVHPQAMIGHSLGEYTAACLSGVFSLEGALALVVLRARLFEQLPEGAMLSVSLPEDEARMLIDERLSIAAVNGPSHCVVSGAKAAIDEMANLLAEREVEFRRLWIDVAAHSHLVEPILDEFTRFIAKQDLRVPTIPYISNVTGRWINDTEAIDPEYWARHLRQTVRFADGIQELIQEPGRILLEVGPGQTLSTLTRLQPCGANSQPVFASMRHPYDSQSDFAVLLTTLGKLWLVGVGIEWAGYYSGERRRRIPLPTYPFERQRYWVEPKQKFETGLKAKLGKRPDIDQWFYTPSWNRTLSRFRKSPLVREKQIWMIMEDEVGVGEQICERLKKENQEVIRVRTGEQAGRGGAGEFIINPQCRNHYVELVKRLVEQETMPSVILHLWSITSETELDSGLEFFCQAQNSGFYSLLYLAQALEEQSVWNPLRLTVISNNTLEVESRDIFYPEKSSILGLCRVAPQEYENITCRYIDITLADIGSKLGEGLIEHLIAEAGSDSHETVVAYRGTNRWVQTYQQAPLKGDTEPIKPLRDKGVYLITGGLGGIGLLLADYLARHYQARLILNQRSSLPDRGEWEAYLASHDDLDIIGRKIRKVQSLELMGAEVMIVSADVADEDQMRQVVRQAVERFGDLHCVIHAAGLSGEDAIRLIPGVTRNDCETHFRPKAHGLYVLEKVLAGRCLDFCLLISSNASILGGLGSASYASSNIFMDAFATHRSRDPNSPWMSVSWDGWLQHDERQLASFQTSLDQYAMLPDESAEAFKRVVSQRPAGHVIVSTGELNHRIDLWIGRQGARGKAGANGNSLPPALYPRPALGTAYVPPKGEIEEQIVGIWQDLLGVERIGVHDNFFELGGNSLISLKVISQLKKDLNLDVPIVAIFEKPTVSALAGLISSGMSGESSYGESRSRGEKRREKRRRQHKIAKPNKLSL